MVSQRLDFERLLNTRDLGGMTGADGRKIREGKLYRSGHLFGASAGDLERIGNLIDVSVDFRSVAECSEKPEPFIAGVQQLHLPVFDENAAGVERDEDSFTVVREKMLKDASVAKRYMYRAYEGFIRNDHSIRQYGRFVRCLLEEHEKGILWHCTAGKDRAGFGTIIVQELLGVDRKSIREDYLYTNVCLEEDIKNLANMLMSIAGVDKSIAAEAVGYVFAANNDYIDLIYKDVESMWGSFDGYLEKGLRITAAERRKLRDMYLL